MASPLRFLPFVSENTHISAIYKKLVEGSKGIAEDTILSMAGIIYKKGIETVREDLEDLAKFSNLESWAARYEALIRDNENLRVPAGTAAFLKLVSVHLSDEELKLLKELKIPDLGLAFILATQGSPEEQVSLKNFYNLIHTLSVDIHIANFYEFGLFKDGCKPQLVGSKQELKAYIFYETHIRPCPEERHPVTLIYAKRP